MSRISGVGVLSAIALALCLPTTSIAAGGNTIASAPTVVYGQRESGNTATDGGAEAGSLDHAMHCSTDTTNGWWNLTVRAGDTVIIDWEATSDHWLDVYPVGTTDFTQPDTDPFAQIEINSNGKAELRFVTSRAGTMPMVFSATGDCFGPPPTGGPYDFTAFDRHASHRVCRTTVTGKGRHRRRHRACRIVS